MTLVASRKGKKRRARIFRWSTGSKVGWAGLEAGLNGKIVGINCVLSTDSMCKKVSFLGNITVSLDPSREGNSGVMKFLDGNIFDKIIRDTVSGCGPKERERERDTRTRNSREY